MVARTMCLRPYVSPAISNLVEPILVATLPVSAMEMRLLKLITNIMGENICEPTIHPAIGSAEFKFDQPLDELLQLLEKSKRIQRIKTVKTYQVVQCLICHVTIKWNKIWNNTATKTA